jgi:hypothetical protein
MPAPPPPGAGARGVAVRFFEKGTFPTCIGRGRIEKG